MPISGLKTLNEGRMASFFHLASPFTVPQSTPSLLPLAGAVGPELSLKGLVAWSEKLPVQAIQKLHKLNCLTSRQSKEIV